MNLNLAAIWGWFPYTFTIIPVMSRREVMIKIVQITIHTNCWLYIPWYIPWYIPSYLHHIYYKKLYIPPPPPPLPTSRPGRRACPGGPHSQTPRRRERCGQQFAPGIMAAGWKLGECRGVTMVILALVISNNNGLSNKFGNLCMCEQLLNPTP